MTPLQKVAFYQLMQEKVEAMETIQELRDYIQFLRDSEMNDFADELESVTLVQWEVQDREGNEVLSEVLKSQRAA